MSLSHSKALSLISCTNSTFCICAYSSLLWLPHRSQEGPGQKMTSREHSSLWSNPPALPTSLTFKTQVPFQVLASSVAGLLSALNMPDELYLMTFGLIVHSVWDALLQITPCLSSYLRQSYSNGTFSKRLSWATRIKPQFLSQHVILQAWFFPIVLIFYILCTFFCLYTLLYQLPFPSAATM